jgi:hypothetical protein
MAELDTPEQALAYLARIFPETSFDVLPFEMGWVCSPVLTPEKYETGAHVGSTKLVIDSQTGVVLEFPSWSTPMVKEEYLEAKRTGQRPPARQVYPYQWRITIHRIREDPDTIVYQMTAVSLTDPPKPTQEHPVTIYKHTHLSDPPDTLSAMAMVHAEKTSRENRGSWPAEATTEF